MGRAGDSVGLKFYRITPSGCRTKARMSKTRAEGGRQESPVKLRQWDEGADSIHDGNSGDAKKLGGF